MRTSHHALWRPERGGPGGPQGPSFILFSPLKPADQPDYVYLPLASSASRLSSPDSRFSLFLPLFFTLQSSYFISICLYIFLSLSLSLSLFLSLLFSPHYPTHNRTLREIAGAFAHRVLQLAVSNGRPRSCGLPDHLRLRSHRMSSTRRPGRNTVKINSAAR